MKPLPDWWTRFEMYPELEDKEERLAFHLTFGYCAANVSEFVPDTPLDPDISQPIGTCDIHTLWLVHYANRTLNRIVGRIELALGEYYPLTAQQLVTDLALS